MLEIEAKFTQFTPTILNNFINIPWNCFWMEIRFSFQLYTYTGQVLFLVFNHIRGGTFPLISFVSGALFC